MSKYIAKETDFSRYMDELKSHGIDVSKDTLHWHGQFSRIKANYPESEIDEIARIAYEVSNGRNPYKVMVSKLMSEYEQAIRDDIDLSGDTDMTKDAVTATRKALCLFCIEHRIDWQEALKICFQRVRGSI